MDKLVLFFLLSALLFNCKQRTEPEGATRNESYLDYSRNVLDYRVTPRDSLDRSGLMFSDQGAWFAYGLPKTKKNIIGFSGPFLMTQQNGVWSDIALSQLLINEGDSKNSLISFKDDLVTQTSYASHLEQLLENEKIKIKQELLFGSEHTALQRFTITNVSKYPIDINIGIQGGVSDIGISLLKESNTIKMISDRSTAIGHIQVINNIQNVEILDGKRFYSTQLKGFKLQPNEDREIVISHTLIFPKYSWQNEQKLLKSIDFDSVLKARKLEKEIELKSLISNRKSQFTNDKYAEVLAKSYITLQNNWRVAAGELKHDGLFPSYHYEWFNGFWSWDSWKHAVGLSYYNTTLAKNQIRAMFDYQNEDGFVADCIYRDTIIEAHNYRDTKPPLSAWAVAKIYEKDKDIAFVKELYSKLKKYHNWWYSKRDHDRDGLCEYGSTDGSLIAAKWESGMDNAIRFDNSKILKNDEGAYSLNQESVDLNAYLYAEKLYLSELAIVLKLFKDSEKLISEANTLKQKIQNQFYDKEGGWFYDTNIEGSVFIKGEGSEGWTALWAKAATREQAKAVKQKMMDITKFYTKVPFQTMSADHEKFNPLKGYWRGPNWLDQAYFGVEGLRNYGFYDEADEATIQILEGAEGLLGKGKSIRENYHPITGEGLNAKNFSWSAAHIIMLLTQD